MTRRRHAGLALAVAVVWSLTSTAAAGAASVGWADLDGSSIDPNLISIAPWGSSTLYAPAEVAVDRSHLYWANPAAHTIERANLDGSRVEPDFIKVPPVGWATGAPEAVAVGAGQIYWTTSGAPPRPFASTVSYIGRANLDGSRVEPALVTAGNVMGIAVDDPHIYWTDNTHWVDASDRGIGRANLDGSAADPNFIAAGNGFLVGIAVDSTHIYWASECIGGPACSRSAIGRANLDGSGVEQTFISSATYPADLAVSGRYIFWTKRDPFPGIVPVQTADTIGRANLDGSGVLQNLITLGWVYLGGVAVDGAHVYWTSSPRPTSELALTCTPTEVTAGGSSACTATVRDISPTPSTPSGAVTFAARPGSVSARSCTLSGGGPSASCHVVYRSAPRASYPTITARYDGDSTHTASSGTTTITVFVVPHITNVAQSARRWRRGSALPTYTQARSGAGTTFTFTLDQPYAPVRFDFIRTVSGRLVGGSCTAPTTHNRGEPRCRRTAIAATLRHEWRDKGRKRLHFEGRINRRAWLAPGSYTMKITATANGRSSRPAFLHFTILR